MSMEIYDVNKWTLIIDVDLKFSDIKKINSLVQNLKCIENWEEINLEINDIIKLEYDITKWLLINLKHNTGISYIDYCIPNFSKELLFENILYLISKMTSILDTISDTKFAFAWFLSFHTTEDDYPLYKIFIINEDRLILARKKDIIDYKNYLSILSNVEKISQNEIKKFLKEEYIEINNELNNINKKELF